MLSGAVSGAISVIPIPGLNAWATVAITGLSNIGNITNRELTAIRQAFKYGITVDKLIKLMEKYGYDVVLSAFVSSTMATAVQ